MQVLNYGSATAPYIGIFGEASSESWQTDISMNFVYGLPEGRYKDLSTGGTVTVIDNLLHVDNDGGTGKFQTVDRVRYRNGHSLACRFTTILSAQPLSARSIIINKNAIIESEQLNIENIDFTNCQIYQESYGYLGFAPVAQEIFGDFGFHKESVIRFNGRKKSTHVSTPYSAFTCKVEDGKITVGLFEDDSGVAIEFTMPPGVQWCRSGSIFAGVLASSLSPSNSFNQDRSRKVDLAVAAHAGTTWRNIATYRSVGTFKGIDNKILTSIESLRYLLFDLASGETDYTVCLARNATPADAFSFSNVKSSSIVQVDKSNTDLTILESDILWADPGYAVAGQGSRAGDFSSKTEDSVRDGIVIEPGNGTLSIAVKCPTVFSFQHSLSWRELF